MTRVLGNNLPLTWFRQFRQLLGRYCSYQLPGQDGGTFQIQVNGRLLLTRPVTLCLRIEFSVQLARLGELKKPVLCVEPVKEMLDVAVSNELEGIETLCETAEEFVKRDIKYDKIIMKGCVHHFPRSHLQDIFKGIHSQLNEGGILLIDKVSGNPVCISGSLI